MKKVFLILNLFLLTIAVKAQDVPKVISPFAPEKFPAFAWMVKGLNEVEIEVTINSDGKVTSAKTISGHPFLRKSSEEASLKWLFSKAAETKDERKTHIFFRYDILENEPKFIDGDKSEINSEITNQFVEPNQLTITQNKTHLLSKIELLPRLNGKIEDKFCEVHRVKMKTEIVDIIYGLTVPNKGFEDLFEKEEILFPNANTKIFAGCIAEPTEKKEVYYCEKCRRAKINWTEKRKRKLLLDKVVES